MADKEPEFVDAEGVARKAHYGAGKQPWDTIKELGWGGVFAAANVLKYIRRYMLKNGVDDIAKANWYYAELVKLADINFVDRITLLKLRTELTADELGLLAA